MIGALRILVILGLLLGGLAPCQALAESEDLGTMPPVSRKFVENKLRRERFSKGFVDVLLKTYEDRSFETVVELNVLLYLRKSDYHGPQVSSPAVDEVLRFMKKQDSNLRAAEKRYGVDRNVIASLLWIESRLGKNAGNFHVPSVYLHLIQAPRVSVQKFLMKRAIKYRPEISAEDHREIVARTHRKADWAIGELRALERVHRWNWKVDRTFRGSFSGAFGWPQFLPSSYVKWARAKHQKRQPDLTKPQDSIFSVAYYLKDHGWKNVDREKQLQALYKYNNSWDYAKAILELGERVSEQRIALEGGSQTRRTKDSQPL